MKQSKVNIDSFKTISVIGKGSYAKVLLVRKVSSGDFYAMKILKKTRIEKKNQEEHVQTERNILVAMSDRPFMIKLHHSFQNDKKLYFILEYCPGGELFELLSKKRKFTEDQTRFYAAQIVIALEHMHSKDIIYRDLKPENVLLDLDGYIKITDFGLSKMNISNKEATSICGTPEYLAPEIILKKKYGKAIDWWTLGCIIYEMLVGIPPFYENKRNVLFDKIKNQSPKYPKYLSESSIEILNALLCKDPNQRLGSIGGGKEVKNHSWFGVVNWNHLVDKRYEAPFKPQIKGDMGLGNFSKDFLNLPVDSLSVNENNGKNFEDFTFSLNHNDNQKSFDKAIET